MNQNNAVQSVLTDDEIRAIITDAHQSHGAFKTGYGLSLGRAIESALLSKLRAPVANERALPPLPKPYAQVGKFLDDATDVYTAEQMQAFGRAAQASAPVTGMQPLEPEFAKVLSDNFESLMVRAPVADESPIRRALVAASNYIDTLGGDSKTYRAALESAPVVPQACPTDVCQAAKADGVLCANDECDRSSSVRPASAPVADERALPPLPAAWGSAINDAGDGHVDLYSAEQMQEYARAHAGAVRSVLASAAAIDAGELPPLPVPAIEGSVLSPQHKIAYSAPVHFTADQMRDYARAALASAPVAVRLPPRESENCGSSSAIAYAMAYNKALDDVAALNASAPVAGEAQPVAQAHLYMHNDRRQFVVCELGTKAAADLPLGKHDLYAAPQASEAMRDAVHRMRNDLMGIEEDVKHSGYAAFDHTCLKTLQRVIEGLAALSAQPAAKPLSNPKQFALTAAENIRAGAPYDDPAFEALCREHGIWGTAEAALCAVFWRQRAAGADERAAFEATYQADYDDPGTACELEHFGKGYRAGLAAQPAKEQNDAN